MASMLVFEVLVIGVPVLVATGDNPEAVFIIIAGIIAMDAIGKLHEDLVPKYPLLFR